jgi:large subunit ribosomal protein L16
MLLPKKTKYRKMHKGRNRGIATSGTNVSFGTYALKTTELARITSRQIEAARRTISRSIKRGGKVWIRIFPDKPITTKPLEVRMGSGKGSVEYWVALVQPGKVLFELEGVEPELARQAFTLAGAKLPVKTLFVVRTVK